LITINLDFHSQINYTFLLIIETILDTNMYRPTLHVDRETW